MSSQKFHAFIALILIILVAAGVIALVSASREEPEPTPTPAPTQTVPPAVSTPQPSPSQTPTPSEQPDETPEPENSPEPQETPVSSGEFSSDTGTKLNIKLRWSVFERADGGREMRIELYAVSYSMAIGPRSGSISVLGEETRFSSPSIDYSGEDMTATLIYELRVELPKDASEIAVSAVWEYDGVYSGRDIEKIEASALVKP